MSYIGNILFAFITIGVFTFFIRSLMRTWTLITATQGVEENRTNNPLKRIFDVLFLGFLQKKTMKDRTAGLMHAGIFWGFILVSSATLESIIGGVFPSFDFRLLLGDDTAYHTYLIIQDAANMMVVAAILFAFYRRLFAPPQRIKTLPKESKRDAYIVLGLILILVSTSLMHMGVRTRIVGDFLNGTFLPFGQLMTTLFSPLFSNPKTFSTITWLLHIGALYTFMIFLPFSKHQHLIWIWPNLFFRSHHPRGRIRPMEFSDDAESFGVAKADDLTFKQRLDAQTCVECGRCSEACPAFNTEKPLDPRKIMHDIKTAMRDEAELKKLNKTSEAKSIVPNYMSEDELWSCTTCAACMEACPLHIEHIPSIVDMRRNLTLTEGNIPDLLSNIYKNLENNYTPWAFSHQTRADWAKDLDVTTMAQKNDVEYLFWVGCAGSYDERQKKVSRAIVKILKQAGVSFSILGTEEKCNGDTARRLGNEYLANMAITENVDTLNKYKVKKIVTSCPHCFNTIKNEYPDFGFKAEVLHHSQLIADLVRTGKITFKQDSDLQTVTYHDSCYLGRHNNIYDQPRQILSSIKGTTIKEMTRCEEDGFCCGAGGGRMWLEETLGSRININRAKEAISTGADLIATACPFCMTMLGDGVKAEQNSLAVKDIAEIVADSMV